MTLSQVSFTHAVVHSLRRVMDRIELATQGRPLLARAVRVIRASLSAFVRRFVKSALRRPELAQAAQVMADALPQPRFGPKVLMMTFRAWTTHVAWELTIGQGLRHRGARVEIFRCGGGLPICEIGWASRDEGRPCAFCAPYVSSMTAAARFPTTSLGDVVPAAERDEILRRVRVEAERDPKSVEVCGLRLFPLAEQSILWFFRSGTLPETPETRRGLTDFIAGAAVVAVAAGRLLDRTRPDVLFMVNGLFFEERIVREVAHSRGIRVVTYEMAARRGTLFFSDDEGSAAPDYDVSELWRTEGTALLSEDQEHRLDTVLASRAEGSGLARSYYGRPREIERPPDRPLVALFTNVSWDTAVTGKSYAFPSMFDWIAATIAAAQRNPALDLVVRVHPAESRLRHAQTREPAASWIAEHFPVLPPNVRVIPPHEAVSSYALIQSADAICVFSSTIGLEAAALGKTVCVAGKTHYRGCGFTIDAESAEHYRALFEDLSWTAPDPERQARARRYAYLFFCRSMIPFPAVGETEPSAPVFNYSSVAELAPGRDPMLDLICERILHAGPFWLPETVDGTAL